MSQTENGVLDPMLSKREIMKSKYPKIFEPITIKRTTIKNRIAMTPMGTNYGETSG